MIILLTLLAISGVGLSIYYGVKLSYVEKEKKRIETSAKEIEDRFNQLHLENLEARLNPHLLKNILNSIQSHAYQTYFALDKLGNVLDYMLYESKKQFISPKNEIQFALSLIEINKIKISPLFNLTVKTKINETEPLYTQNLLAPLISVDLIENAFKHADLQSSDSFISIIFEFKNDQFIQTVTNKIAPGTPLKKDHSGIGKEVLENRLKIIYKDHYKLEEFIENDIHIAHLKINLFEHKAQMLATR